MIETIEHFAQTQPSHPVYNVSKAGNTLMEILNILIVWLQPSINWITREALWLFLYKNKKCWQLVALLTKLGHAYIPIR